MRKIFTLVILSYILFGMGNDNINYDEKFDSIDESLSSEEGSVSVEELETIKPSATPQPPLDKSEILSNLELKTYIFQQRDGKNVPVTKVLKNSQVIYLDRVVNRGDVDKHNIIVKNPIPKGVDYVRGSATCNGECKIFYSNNNGETLSTKQNGKINFIEFVFDNIPAGGEVRMGFRAIVREGG
jgi:uncharacterized repeat protein (TIGR01451 family)